MIKINRTAVDKAIKNMDGMFNATKEVLAAYETEKKVLVDRKEALENRLAELQEQHAQTLMDRELAKDDPSEYIYLSTQLTKVNEEVTVLQSLQEQQKEEFIELKKKYMLDIRSTYSEEMSAKNKYFNVSEAVTHVVSELKQVIADYENEIYEQDKQVMSVIGTEFLSDAELMREDWDDPDRRRKALAFKRAFDFDRDKLYYPKEIKL